MRTRTKCHPRVSTRRRMRAPIRFPLVIERSYVHEYEMPSASEGAGADAEPNGRSAAYADAVESADGHAVAHPFADEEESAIAFSKPA